MAVQQSKKAAQWTATPEDEEPAGTPKSKGKERAVDAPGQHESQPVRFDDVDMDRTVDVPDRLLVFSCQHVWHVKCLRRAMGLEEDDYGEMTAEARRAYHCPLKLCKPESS